VGEKQHLFVLLHGLHIQLHGMQLTLLVPTLMVMLMLLSLTQHFETELHQLFTKWIRCLTHLIDFRNLQELMMVLIVQSGIPYNCG